VEKKNLQPSIMQLTANNPCRIQSHKTVNKYCAIIIAD